MNLHRRHLKLGIFLLLTGCLTGCSSSGDLLPSDDSARSPGKSHKGPPSSSSQENVEVQAHAIIVDAAESNDVRVLPSSLVFPAAGHERILASLQRGSILVGQPSTAHSDQNRNGFLRRVASFSKKKNASDEIEVITTPAALTDVFKKGDLTIKVPSSSAPTSVGSKTATIKPKDVTAPLGTFAGPISVSIEVPLSLPGAPNVEGAASVDLDGSYSLTPQLWATASYANDANNTTTDLDNCFQPRPACAQSGQLAPIAACAGDDASGYKSFGMWCGGGGAAGTSERVFCDGQGNGCVEDCGSRYGAGSTCQSMPAGTDDQCSEVAGTNIPRVCLDRGALTHLELGAALDLTVDVNWEATVSASVNGERAVDQITPYAKESREIGVPITTNVIIPGAVPIPVELRGTVYSTCEIAVFGELSASGSTHIHVNPGFGIQYDNGAFSPLPFEEAVFETQVLQVGGAAGVSVKCTPFKPRLSMLLFDGDIVGIGPYVEAGYYREISAKLQTDGACPILVEQTHGIEATVGGEMRIFGVEVTPSFIKEGITVGTNWEPLSSSCAGGQ